MLLDFGTLKAIFPLNLATTIWINLRCNIPTLGQPNPWSILASIATVFLCLNLAGDVPFYTNHLWYLRLDRCHGGNGAAINYDG